MGGLKKGKSGGGKGKGKGPKPEGKRETKKPSQDDLQRDVLLPLQERVAAVKPFWETLSQDERVQILTVSIDDLRQRAAELVERQQKQAAVEEQMYPGETITFDLEPSIEELLELGIDRLKDKPTWKLWQWPPEEKEFLEADSFRNYMESEHIEENLRGLLPKEEGKPVEKPAEAALRIRMSELLQRVHQHNRQLQEEPATGRRSKAARTTVDQMGAALRDSNIELINIMMEALEQEHEFLYHAVLFPITTCICELLEEGQRESSCMDLCFEDLEKLHPDEVARICEWLTEKVDGFSSKIKPEAKDIEEEEDEEEGIGDVDLFSLSEDREHLLVNAKWLQHLQERVLGDDGQPRKIKDGEDPFRMGLVLEWVFGTIVSTAEKARDGAKRTLGTRIPTATQAHDQLVQALREQSSWEKRARDAKELLKRMLKSRKDAAELAQHHDIRPAPVRPAAPGSEGYSEPPEVPDSVSMAMLQREVLLTEAKLHALDYELVTSERKLRQLRSQLRQGEPEFERLKRELEEVKNQPRGLEGTFRSAAEMERHRAQMADAAIEEQLEVQTAFREHGARLQGIYDKRQRTEMEIARKEQEIKQLKGWRQTVQSLIDRFEEHTASLSSATADAADNPADASQQEEALDSAAASHHQALEAATRSITGQDTALAKLRSHFQKDVRRQLYCDEDDRTFFDWIRTELRAVEKKLEDGRAVLHHLEMFLVNVACNDPGAAIGANLVLPLLQDRLDAKALDHAAQRAAAAEEAIIKMEEEMAERARQEREKRHKMKQKAKDKVRTEKERQLAERDAKLEAERAVLEESKREMLEKEEQLRKEKLEEMEKQRKAEEEQMEARRKELLSEEDGYWRRRMAQDAQQQALQEESIVKSSTPQQAEEEPSTSSASDQTSWKDDNDGFRDSAKGPRRSRNPKPGVRKPDAEPAPERPVNGYARVNGKVEDGRFHRHSKGPEMFRENGRRPNTQEGRTLPVREVRTIRSSGSTSASEKGRSGRSSPQQESESGTRQLGDITLHLQRPHPRSSEPAERPVPLTHADQLATKAEPQADEEEADSVPSDSSVEDVSKAAGGSVSVSAEIPDGAPAAPLQTAVPAAEDAGQQPEPATAAHMAQEQCRDETSTGAEQQVKELPPQPAVGALPPPEEPRPPRQGAGPPEAAASSGGRIGHELAPGTPAQQAPPLPMLQPTPSVPEGIAQQPGGGVIFMQSRHAPPPMRNPVPRLVPQQGAPPPPEMGYQRHMAMRRDGGPLPYAGPHVSQLSQGMQNGQAPPQPRRPQIAPPRGQEGGMPPQAFQRGMARGQPPPPPASAPAVQFPQPPGALQPGISHVQEPADLGSAPPMMVPPAPFMGPGASQPGSGPDQASGPPPMMFPGPQGGPMKLPGPQPMPQHVFVGNMVNPPFGMMNMGQMPPLMHGTPGPANGPMHHPGGSPPGGHVFPGGSPRHVHPQVRPAYARGSPVQQRPATTLRASAPSFVPGGSLRPATGSQPQLPRKPVAEQQRQPEERPVCPSPAGQLPRPASSGAVNAVPAPPRVPRSSSDTAAQRAASMDFAAVQSHEPAEHDRSGAASVGSSQDGVASVASEAQARPAAASEASAATAGQQQGQEAAPATSPHPEPQSIVPRGRPEARPPQSAEAPPESFTSQPAAARAATQQQARQQPPKWSAVAAMERQGAHSQAGPSSNGRPMRKSGSAEAIRSSGKQHEAPKRPVNQPPNNLKKSGSGSQIASRQTAGTRTAGDKRKITRAGGVTWEGLQGELHRLRLVRGLSNEAGRNNCFLNVIIQSLWHLRCFRETLLRVQPQALEARGGPAEDVRVLKALWNIFNAFNQPREELPAGEAEDGTPKSGLSGNGEEADAKRAKREGQEDAAAAKVTKGWIVSPAELREALSSVSHAALRFDLADMHDAAEVLDKIFSSLQRAEVGRLAEGEPDAALPQKVRIPAPGASAPQQNGAPQNRRRPSSLVEGLFGLDVQVPCPPDDEEAEAQTVKRSKGTGGAVVGRWQETPSRPGRNLSGSPSAPKPTPSRKPKDTSTIEMLQFTKLYHLVPAQGLKVAYDHLIGSSFEEVLKEADVAEVLAQNATSGTHSLISRVAKTSDIVLLKRPRVFSLAIGWESAQAPGDVINATIDALAPQVDPAGVFKSAPRGGAYHLRCIVCYFGHHYKAYALSEELGEWLLFDDTTISHIGSWKDVTASLRGSRLQPNLLFYEQSA